VGVLPTERDDDETVILLPLSKAAKTDHAEIADALQRLEPATLLFLRQIEEVSWSVEGGSSGIYLRESEEVDAGVHRVTVMGQEQGRDENEEAWLLFSRPVTTDAGRALGSVQIAFNASSDGEHAGEGIRRLDASPLVVYFPTVLETHLGFLAQGPYRTTPSRDNVPQADPWNQSLARETATLLVGALRWLRDRNWLDISVLSCLPLEAERFGPDTMFGPLFSAVRDALRDEPLTPQIGGGYAPAARAMLSRSRELRDLVAPQQLATLYGRENNVAWLTGEITQDRYPQLRGYLMSELGVEQATPDSILNRMDEQFLRQQPDDWILKLYEFLGGQQGLHWRARMLPIVRLATGAHVMPFSDGQPQAFLPSQVETGFPTVREAVCATDASRAFLESLDLTEPDPVDDAVRNVLPRYAVDGEYPTDEKYQTDIRRLVSAFATDSATQRRKLVAALREAAFVAAVDAGDRSKQLRKPGELLLATQRLKGLFAGVPFVLFVDDSHQCLCGEAVRELLEACGASRRVRLVDAKDLGFEPPDDLLNQWRRKAGCKQHAWPRIKDPYIEGLDALLEELPSLPKDEAATRAGLLWTSLRELRERRGEGALSGLFDCGHSTRPSVAFKDVAVFRVLNASHWVPSASGQLRRPTDVAFDSLGWPSDPFLESRIRFRPPIIGQLATEAGFEPSSKSLSQSSAIRVR
jgi:hypothetical protein